MPPFRNGPQVAEQLLRIISHLCRKSNANRQSFGLVPLGHRRDMARRVPCAPKLLGHGKMPLRHDLNTRPRRPRAAGECGRSATRETPTSLPLRQIARRPRRECTRLLGEASPRRRQDEGYRRPSQGRVSAPSVGRERRVFFAGACRVVTMDAQWCAVMLTAAKQVVSSDLPRESTQEQCLI